MKFAGASEKCPNQLVFAWELRPPLRLELKHFDFTKLGLICWKLRKGGEAVRGLVWKQHGKSMKQIVSDSLTAIVHNGR